MADSDRAWWGGDRVAARSSSHSLVVGVAPRRYERVAVRYVQQQRNVGRPPKIVFRDSLSSSSLASATSGGAGSSPTFSDPPAQPSTASAYAARNSYHSSTFASITRSVTSSIANPAARSASR